MTTAWTPSQVLQIDLGAVSIVPAIVHPDKSGLDSGRYYWDMWPIQDQDGRIAKVGGREFWMALTAPDRNDPALRHFEAKIRLIERRNGEWYDLGPVLPDSVAPYEREWAGSAVTDGTTVSLYFTGAGVSTRPHGYQQALYEAHASVGSNGVPCDWSAPVLSVNAPSPCYQPANAHEGEPGQIKAFRDPSWFRDPADGNEYLVFTASLAGSASDHNGAVAIARKVGSGWEVLPPLVHADGVNNELERAHVVAHRGRYYVFWATQSGTFAPSLRHAPTGLYGMVADSLFGEYRPLNGSGLVLANPEHEPSQTYSWFVTADLVVSSFVDFCAFKGRSDSNEADAASGFVGLPAPLLRLTIEGDQCLLAEAVAA